MAKPKAGLLAILGGSPEGEEPGGEAKEEESEAMDMKEAAMEDFLSATEAKDPKAMAEAFKRAYDACVSAKEAEAEEY